MDSEKKGERGDDPPERKIRAEEKSVVRPNMLLVNGNGVSSTLANTNFSHSVLTQMSFFNSRVHQSNFEGAAFDECDLDGATFTGCSLRGVEFVNCDLDRVIVNGLSIGTLLKLLQGAGRV